MNFKKNMDQNKFKIMSNEDIKKIFNRKIVQTNNYNSYSELFVYGNEVYKIYMSKPELSQQNLNMLNLLFKFKNELSPIKEIVLPNNILKYNDYLVGFTMPYIEGTLLMDFLQNANVETAKNIFMKILYIINQVKQLNFSFSFNDLHEKNIIIDNNEELHLIDCDGFVINNNSFKENDTIIYGKYLNNNVTTKNINSIDHICLLCMIMNYLLANIKDYSINPISFFENINTHNYVIKNIIERTKKDNFILTIYDIENLFRLDFTKLESKPSVLKRIRNKIDIYKFKKLVIH